MTTNHMTKSNKENITICVMNFECWFLRPSHACVSPHPFSCLKQITNSWRSSTVWSIKIEIFHAPFYSSIFHLTFFFFCSMWTTNRLANDFTFSWTSCVRTPCTPNMKIFILQLFIPLIYVGLRYTFNRSFTSNKSYYYYKPCSLIIRINRLRVFFFRFSII